MARTKTKKTTLVALSHLGLGDNEAMLYTLMLEHPKATVQELQERSPFPRTMLYYVLKNLIAAGLVTSVKEKWRTVYIAEDPERLYDILEARQQEFDAKKQEVRSLIPELRETYRLSNIRPTIRMFEGLRHYRSALDDVFSTGADMMYLYVPSGTYHYPGLDDRRAWNERRIERGISMQILAHDTAGAEIYASSEKKAAHVTTVRILPDTLSFPDMEMRLYNGKVFHTSGDEHQPIVTIIENQTFYEAQKALFTVMYETTNSTKKDMYENTKYTKVRKG